MDMDTDMNKEMEKDTDISMEMGTDKDISRIWFTIYSISV
jgi:hypothetical protein